MIRIKLMVSLKPFLLFFALVLLFQIGSEFFNAAPGASLKSSMLVCVDTIGWCVLKSAAIAYVLALILFFMESNDTERHEDEHDHDHDHVCTSDCTHHH